MAEMEMSQHMLSRRASTQIFFAICALLFISSVAMTIIWGAPMTSMDEMPMPGGWSMSMAWMRMPGETWFGAAASFVGMWIIMMAAMMLPSLLPMLWRYREAIARLGQTHLARLCAMVGAGYFLVWTLFGIVVFPIGAMLVAVEMRHPALARTAPFMTGVAVLAAGVLQFTAWKARHLACCRATPGCCDQLRADAATAWRHGLCLGMHCCYGCSGLTVVLLAIGVMDLRAMAAVTTAITVERLAPASRHAAFGIGVAAIVAGLLMVVRAVGQ
jgi:predicted metal-binding membrane protein